MRLKETSFTCHVTTKGSATPDFTQDIGQSKYHYMSQDGFNDIAVALLYFKKDELSSFEVSLGKGGKRYTLNDLTEIQSECVVASLFDNIFVNGIHLQGMRFILYILKDKNPESPHFERRQLKFSRTAKYQGVSINEDCIKSIGVALGCSKEGSWIVTDMTISLDDNSRPMLNLAAIVVDKEKNRDFLNVEERSQFIQRKLLSSQGGAKSGIDPLPKSTNLPLQQIYYGAPGTGKSHIIKEQTKGKSVIRTTFHPDSDYSTFVGAYKPTTKDVVLRDLSGHIVKEDGQVVREAKIVYEFVSQSFLQAYVSAWKAYAETEQGGTAREQFLVIEEINRGNCAQIFGDLFQLLDRNDQGFSDYPIVADNDMRVQLAKAFAGLQIPHSDAVNSLYDEENIVGKVLAGEILLLPNNLYIRATMNTSDQSLFPIDSAFKRRWDWKYMPISNAGKGWRIAVNGAEYDWWQFLTKVNEYVGGVTNSEDKKLGYFFCKPNGNIIDAEKLVGKVLFYLWNDVFKDYGLNGSLFQATDGGTLTFDKFFDGGTNRINESNVKQFMQNLGVEALESEEVDENTSDGDKNNYRFDGKDYRTKKDFGVSIILKYIQEHPDFTFEELQRNLTLGDSTTWASRFGDGVVAKSDEIQPGYQRYYVVERTSTDNVKYKIYNNWYHDTINYIIDFAKAQGWSVEQCAS